MSEFDEFQVISTEERSYFSLMPHIADDELDAYEYRLYGHYRRVCGESGKPCVEKTDTTADRCQVSHGTVVKARKRLEDKGYIRLHYMKRGHVERVHVTLVDIWSQNMLRYADRSGSLHDQSRSPDDRDRSLHDRDQSPHDRSQSPHDRYRSPHDRPKNNLNKNNPPKKNSSKKNPPPSSSFVAIEEGLAGGSAALKEEGTACSAWPAVRSDLLALAKAMLEECGLVAEIAEEFAQHADFETLREYVMAWRSDPEAGVGALKHRIENKWRHSPLIAQDYADPFYLKYRTPEELALDEAGMAAQLGDEQTFALSSTATVTPMAAHSEHAKLWADVLEDMGHGAPTNGFRLAFAETAPVTLAGDELVIAAPAAVLDILRNRYGRKILRAVHGAAGRPLLVAFVAKETIRS